MIVNGHGTDTDIVKHGLAYLNAINKIYQNPDTNQLNYQAYEISNIELRSLMGIDVSWYKENPFVLVVQ